VQKIVGDVLKILGELRQLVVHAVARHARELPDPFRSVSVIGCVLHTEIKPTGLAFVPGGLAFNMAFSPAILRLLEPVIQGWLDKRAGNYERRGGC
jgi:hypothetical protein